MATPAASQELPVSTREMWGWVRAQQILEPGLTYLDTAAIGPGLRAALGAEFRQQEQFGGDVGAYQRSFLSGTTLGALLQKLAALLDCDRNELTVTQGASEALALVAQGLDFSTGDEILIAAHAHPSAMYPWLLRAQRHGYVVKQVALPSPLNASAEPLGLLAAAVTERTRVIVISHLQHTDGAVLPVGDICTFARQRNIVSVVDGAQAVGSLDVSLRAINCDFYAASLHKWVNGPQGLGVLYVRRALLDRVFPLTPDTNMGWNAINRFGQAAPDPGEEAFQELRSTWPATLQKFGGAVRFLGPRLRALQTALEFREQLDPDRIEARIRELAIYARLRLQSFANIELLTPAAPGMWGGILAFRPKQGTAKSLADRLTRTDRIAVSAVTHPAANAPAFEAVRASFHIYNSHDDVERLVRGVQKYL